MKKTDPTTGGRFAALYALNANAVPAFPIVASPLPVPVFHHILDHRRLEPSR